MSNYSKSPHSGARGIENVEGGVAGVGNDKEGLSMVRSSRLLPVNGELEGYDFTYTVQTQRDPTYRSQDTSRRTARDENQDTNTCARRSTSHNQTTCPQCLNKEQCLVTPTHASGSTSKSSSTPAHVHNRSTHQIGHALVLAEHEVEAYDPMKRWEEEKWQEQPWCGLARE